MQAVEILTRWRTRGRERDRQQSECPPAQQRACKSPPACTMLARARTEMVHGQATLKGATARSAHTCTAAPCADTHWGRGGTRGTRGDAGGRGWGSRHGTPGFVPLMCAPGAFAPSSHSLGRAARQATQRHLFRRLVSAAEVHELRTAGRERGGRDARADRAGQAHGDQRPEGDRRAHRDVSADGIAPESVRPEETSRKRVRGKNSCKERKKPNEHQRCPGRAGRRRGGDGRSQRARLRARGRGAATHGEMTNLDALLEDAALLEGAGPRAHTAHGSRRASNARKRARPRRAAMRAFARHGSRRLADTAPCTDSGARGGGRGGARAPGRQGLHRAPQGAERLRGEGLPWRGRRARRALRVRAHCAQRLA